MKITVSVTIDSGLAEVWQAWNDPQDIMQWNAASEDWHTTASRVDLREGGTFCARMEAKDGSAGFDFTGTYSRVIPMQRIEYVMEDGRGVSVEFTTHDGRVAVTETFDAEATHSIEQQRAGWQSILENFARHVQSRAAAGGKP